LFFTGPVLKELAMPHLPADHLVGLNLPSNLLAASSQLVPMNVAVPNFLVHCARIASSIDPSMKNQSDVHRAALADFIENHPDAATIRELALKEVRNAERRKQLREQSEKRIEPPLATNPETTDIRTNDHSPRTKRKLFVKNSDPQASLRRTP
jgi:hypothetical protein